ncbi:MAG: hypothetical protein V4594_10140 [Bacteroidota bacterium]
MTTAIENIELDTELQELYLIGKQWLSDLEFLQEELAFLGKLAEITALPELHADYEQIFLLEKTHLVLKADAVEFLKKIEHLIGSPDKAISIELLEEHVLLKLQLEDLKEKFRSGRKLLFEMILRVQHERHS